MTAKELGEIIKRTRRSKKYSQLLLAGLSDKPRSTIERIENQTECVSISNLLLILDKLDLELKIVNSKSDT